MKPRELCLIALLLAVSQIAGAHAVPRSSSVWRIDGDTLRVTYFVPRAELDRLLEAGYSSDASAVNPGAYLQSHLRARRGGQACTTIGAPVVQLAREQATAVLDESFHCDAQGDLELTASAFFEVSPLHTHLSRVAIGDRIVDEFSFTRQHPSHRVSAGGIGPGSGALGAALQSLQLGITHIAGGADHLAFLLGLILIAPGVRRVLALTAGFTIGHSVTLALAYLDIIHPRSAIVEGLVAFTVLLVAAEAAGQRLGSRWLVSGVCIAVALIGLLASLHSAEIVRPVGIFAGLALLSYSIPAIGAQSNRAQTWTQFGITIAFGLIHGMAFAGGLQELQVDRSVLIPALAGFNAGVECGQLLFVMAVVALTQWARRSWRTLDFAAPLAAASVVLGCAAAWWYVDRMVGA